MNGNGGSSIDDSGTDDGGHEHAATWWVPSTEGVRVAVHDLGGDGPPALLAHATGFAGRMWEPVAAALAGHHCFAFDARAHGRTITPPTAARTWPAVAQDLLAALDAVGLRTATSGPIAAAGHSMGASALLLAELARPGSFASLYCYEPVTSPAGQATDPTGADLQDESLARATLRRRPGFASVQHARDNFAAKEPFSLFHAPSLEAYLRHCFRPLQDGDVGTERDMGLAGNPAAVTLCCERQDESAFYVQGRYHGLYERVGHIGCPVVVGAGAPRDGAPSNFAAEVARRLPRGRLLTYEDLGHFGPQQAPDRIASDILTAWRMAPPLEHP